MDPDINGEEYKEIQSGGRRVQHVCEKKEVYEQCCAFRYQELKTRESRRLDAKPSRTIRENVKLPRIEIAANPPKQSISPQESSC